MDIFVDFTKAFNIVNREALWNILWKLWCPNHFIKLISALHLVIQASVSLRGELLEPFEVGNGEKWGYVLASLCLIFLSIILSDGLLESISDGLD